MVKFEKSYEFVSKWGSFKAHARTYDTHSGYGNDTGVEIMLENDTHDHIEPLLYDIRYTGIWTPQEVDEFVKAQLAEQFGIAL